MNSEVCLSCEDVERYLGEEEERVHALRGVSLAGRARERPRRCWPVRLRQKLVALYSRLARPAGRRSRFNRIGAGVSAE